MNELFEINRFYADNTAKTVFLSVLLIGVSILIGWILTRVMQEKKFQTSMPLNLILSGCLSVVLCLRYGLTVTTVQGMLLGFVLLYASCSDLTDHTVDDFLWVMVGLLALCSVNTVGICSMIIGGAMVFLPQLISAWFSKKPLGGADIKLSSAIAVLLGWQRGLGALLLGLLVAILVMSAVQKKYPKKRKKAFALVPFLSGAAMILFLL